MILELVDLCGGSETPAGGRDRGDPAGALAPGAQINSLIGRGLS
jgi:hypothetical protein